MNLPRLGTILTLITALLVQSQITENDLRFLLVNGGSSFFDPVVDGFNKTCKDLGVSCTNITGGDCEQREVIVREFIQSGGNGIVYRPCGRPDRDRAIIQEAVDANIPVVEFDGSTPDSARSAYVGTDNVFMGKTIAKLLKQLRPEGGTFVIIAPKAGRLEGFLHEIMKDNEREDRAHWYEMESNFSTDGLDLMQVMVLYASLRPTAIILMKQTPMRHENWTKFVDDHRHLNITLIGVDGAQFQLDYLNRRYVDGLVGQLPYEFGSVSMKVIHEVVVTGKAGKYVYDTNVVAYKMIPVELPPVNLDENLIGNLKFVGFTFFGLIAVAAIACVCWTVSCRRSIVVLAAQPSFLVMIAAGVLIMAGALIPLSFDDGGENGQVSEHWRVGICMSIPWLASLGFTVTFSALFSKTWRVNRIFYSGSRYQKVKVRVQDVLLPFIGIFTLNVIVLICWTVFDPLTYVRLEYDGTDFWNRAIGTYGSCRSDHVAAYLIPLGLINFIVLVTACWHAYQARNIESEFSEAKFIGMTMFSFGQGFLTGIRIVAVVRDTPQAFYLVLAMLIFLLCTVTLLLIFLPKYLMQRTYAVMSERQQHKSIAGSVRRSAASKAASSSRLRLGVSASKSSDGFDLSREIFDLRDGNSDSEVSRKSVKPRRTEAASSEEKREIERQDVIPKKELALNNEPIPSANENSLTSVHSHSARTTSIEIESEPCSQQNWGDRSRESSLARPAVVLEATPEGPENINTSSDECLEMPGN